MRIKDYYQILGIATNATPIEIKKSYRRLAMQYHPDKNKDDKIASAHFKEIKEAYETLSHPQKREAYHQQRWYHHAIGKRFANNVPATPHSLLRECLFLDQYVSGLDKFRIDYEGLYLFIIQLLSYETIETLKNFNEPDTNRNIINALLRTGRSSPYKFALKLGERLLLLAGNDEELVTLITHYQQEQKREEEKQKYKVIAALFIVLIICVVIYFAGK
jgi:curved DNA-binding protein CbpA